jgi:hypothetical protein
MIGMRRLGGERDLHGHRLELHARRHVLEDAEVAHLEAVERLAQSAVASPGSPTDAVPSATRMPSSRSTHASTCASVFDPGWRRNARTGSRSVVAFRK